MGTFTYEKNMHQLRIDLAHTNKWVVLDLMITMDKLKIEHGISSGGQRLWNFFTKYGVKLKR
jgi:hypothetical protein